MVRCLPPSIPIDSFMLWNAIIAVYFFLSAKCTDFYRGLCKHCCAVMLFIMLFFLSVFCLTPSQMIFKYKIGFISHSCTSRSTWQNWFTFCDPVKVTAQSSQSQGICLKQGNSLPLLLLPVFSILPSWLWAFFMHYLLFSESWFLPIGWWFSKMIGMCLKHIINSDWSL